MMLSSRGAVSLPLPQARHATVLSAVLLLCFVYANANNWFCSDVYSTVQSLCGSCYAGFDKRSNTITRTIEKPFMERQSAVDFLKRGTARGGTRRGIVEECCTRQCNVHEMMLYCCEEKQREYYTFVGWLKRR